MRLKETPLNRTAMGIARQSRNRPARSVWSAGSLLPLSNRPTPYDSASKLDSPNASRGSSSTKTLAACEQLRLLQCKTGKNSPAEAARAAGLAYSAQRILLDLELRGAGLNAETRRNAEKMESLRVLHCNSRSCSQAARISCAKAEDRQNHGRTESYGAKTEPLLAGP